MTLSKNVEISGTDPNNIRTGGHAIIRIEQIRRDVQAMHEEVGRISHLVALPLGQSLRDKGTSEPQIGERLRAITSALDTLRDALDGVHAATFLPQTLIELSGANLSHRHEWRPIRTHDGTGEVRRR